MAGFCFGTQKRNIQRRKIRYCYRRGSNDDVYRTLQVYASGLLSKEQALEALKVKKLFNQYVFATDKAFSLLKFIKAEEV